MNRARGPQPNERERAEQFYDKAIAQPARNFLGQRAGPRQSEEQVYKIPAVAAGIIEGVHGAGGRDHDRYLSIQAGQANGRTPFNAKNPPPSWDAVDQPELDGFRDGTIPNLSQRRFEVRQAPVNGGRRPNPARIREDF